MLFLDKRAAAERSTGKAADHGIKAQIYRSCGIPRLQSSWGIVLRRLRATELNLLHRLWNSQSAAASQEHAMTRLSKRQVIELCELQCSWKGRFASTPSISQSPSLPNLLATFLPDYLASSLAISQQQSSCNTKPAINLVRTNRKAQNQTYFNPEEPYFRFLPFLLLPLTLLFGLLSPLPPVGKFSFSSSDPAGVLSTLDTFSCNF